jgi:multidrug efflux pump subunit AcrB
MRFSLQLRVRVAACAAVGVLAPSEAKAAEITVHVAPIEDLKAVIATVEPVHQLIARTRIGGAVTAKRKGANAVVMASEILSRLETAKGRIVPDDLEISVTRNYGETATEKANELLFHLALATLSIVGVIVLMVGWREGGVVFVINPTTILLTMFASWMMGYAINRVSLFALIFSIGILVDGAIVVVENIVRHWHMRGDRGLTETAIEAVA